jgi:FdhD protein
MTPSRPETTRILRADGSAVDGVREVAVEAPVAIEVDGLGYAVMMMTPMDLEAFATGFMLTERLADTRADIVDIDLFESAAGWIVRVALSDRCKPRIHDRVRHRTSDTSCGLCGIASLEQLARPVPHRPPAPRVAAAAIFTALGRLRDHQRLNAATGAVHAAAGCSGAGEVIAVFEDVGRHNALDKLIGHGVQDAAFTLVTSRISFEMVDKALVSGTPLLAGISAPTSLAIDHARAHGLTLIALARADAMLVLNDPHDRFGQ